jgi:hypothetical protein
MYKLCMLMGFSVIFQHMYTTCSDHICVRTRQWNALKTVEQYKAAGKG